MLAVIPARGGSRGLPRKNLRLCAGRPLIQWSIIAARDSRLITDIVLSSDDPAILAAAAETGVATVIRPAELATDTATTDAVLMHTLTKVERPDLVVLLQPTVPVRAPGLIDGCIRRLVQTGADSLLTASPLHFVWWAENPDPERAADGKPAWRSQCPRRPRRQDMTARELMYHEDGSVYVTRTELLERTGARLGGHVEVYETARTVDVDDAADLATAEAMLEATP